METKPRNPETLCWHSCPTATTLVIARESGRLSDLFSEEGISLRYLQDEIGHPSVKGASGSFSGNYAGLFRFGGDAPPMSARAHGADTVLVGVIPHKQIKCIAVAYDSAIRSVKELKGKKVSLTKGFQEGSYFLVSAPYRDFLITMDANGLSESNVSYVNPSAGIFEDKITSKPVRSVYNYLNRYAVALLAGETDAIQVNGTRAAELELSGKARLIYDLSEHPEINAGAQILTVPGTLAREFPELVKKFLKMIIETGRWACGNREEVVKMFAKDAGGSEEEVVRGHSLDFHNHLVPEFSDENIVALKRTAAVLNKHEFIDRDFKLEDWMEDRFLKDALQELGD
ncbi:MAG: ABC transporter substrate-binding protein [Desulfobacterales bacterium]|nr:ABC transporter substrate-binding protein [Desulfobacterales bacterium]